MTSSTANDIPANLENNGLTGGNTSQLASYYFNNPDHIGFMNILVKHGDDTYTGFLPMFGLRKI